VFIPNKQLLAQMRFRWASCAGWGPADNSYDKLVWC
jgi:hypothetical protein